MAPADFQDFSATFHRLGGVFRLYGDPAEIEHRVSAYFKAMRRYELPDVAAGADAWIGRGKHFPKPAEWIASIPKRAGRELQALTYSEVQEHLRAERLHYEDEPCGCQSCQEADVTHRMLRYVPETEADDTDARALIGDRVVVRGHWSHGHELARWYMARDAFLAEFAAVKKRLAMPQ